MVSDNRDSVCWSDYCPQLEPTALQVCQITAIPFAGLTAAKCTQNEDTLVSDNRDSVCWSDANGRAYAGDVWGVR